MAAVLQLHEVEDDLVTKLAQRGARKGCSAEAEHLEILRLALDGER